MGLLIILGILLIARTAEAQMGSRLLIFNALQDLLKGDLWESVAQKEVNRYLHMYPDHFRVLGVGTTHRPYCIGEIMVLGSVGESTFFWASPEYPYQVNKVQDETFPWIQIAVIDPNKELNLNLKRAKDLHATIMELMRRDKIGVGAVFVEAVTLNVEYNLTNWIPKAGIDMFGTRGRNPYFQAFHEETSAPWVFFGIYVDEEKVSSAGMVPGQPLLLVGYNSDTWNGGLVNMAEVRNAKVQYYPVDSHQMFQSDLTVTDVRIHENRVSVDIFNLGEMTVEHVRLRVTLPDSKREMDAIYPLLGPQEEKTVRFRLQKALGDKTVFVEIDPENEILEFNEENNRYEKRQPLLGW